MTEENFPLSSAGIARRTQIFHLTLRAVRQRQRRRRLASCSAGIGAAAVLVAVVLVAWPRQVVLGLVVAKGSTSCITSSCTPTTWLGLPGVTRIDDRFAYEHVPAIASIPMVGKGETVPPARDRFVSAITVITPAPGGIDPSISMVAPSALRISRIRSDPAAWTVLDDGQLLDALRQSGYAVALVRRHGHTTVVGADGRALPFDGTAIMPRGRSHP